MQLHGSNHKLQLTRSSDADIDVVTSFVDASNAAPPVVQGDTMGNQLAAFSSAATGDFLAAPTGSEIRRVIECSISNRDSVTSCDVTVKLDASGTDYTIIGPVTLRPGESLHYIHGMGWLPVYLPTNPQLRTMRLAGDQSNSTTTPTEVTGLSITTGIGTFVFKYDLIVQSGATTTGHKFDVNHTGTVGSFDWEWRWLTAATTASDDVPDQDHTAAPGGVVSAYSQRDKGTAGAGVTTDVDTANADIHYIVEGIFVCSADGDLELWHGSDAAAASTVKAGSSLVLIRTGD